MSALVVNVLLHAKKSESAQGPSMYCNILLGSPVKLRCLKCWVLVVLQVVQIHADQHNARALVAMGEERLLVRAAVV